MPLVHPRFPLAPLALTVAFAFAAPDITLAQATTGGTQAVTISIASQSLGAALNELSAATGIPIGFSPALVAGKTAPVIQGNFPARQAVDQLLAGSGLVAVQEGAGIVIKAAANDVAVLSPVMVTAAGLSSAVTEGTGSYTIGTTSTASGFALSLRETPQSVSVVTQQMIQDRHYESLDQALKYTPGVVVAQDSGDTRWEYWSRGSVIDTIQYDGLTFPIQAFTRDVAPDDDLVIYDRVEVVRGATGLLSGAGNPSASINLIRKRGTTAPQASLSTTVSSWGNVRGTFDGAAPLNAAGTLRARTILSGFTGRNQRKSSRSHNGLIYATVDLDVNSATTASLAFSHQQQNNDGYSWTGLPTRRDGSFFNFDQHSFLGSDWFYLDRRQSTLYADIDHSFGNGWTLKAAARGTKASSDYVSGSGYLIAPNYYREDYDVYYSSSSYAFTINASGPFDALGRTHELMLGASTSRDHIWTRGSFVPDTFVGDPEHYDYHSIPRPDLSQNPYTRGFTVRQHGVFAATRLNLADPLTLILGSRMSWYDNQSYTDNLWGHSSAAYNAKAEIVPYVGVVYDINRSYSAYASLTQIFKPQSALDREGSLLAPVKGTNVELGIKGSFADERLNVAAAIFQTRRANLAESLPRTACSPGVLSCAEAAQQVRTRGVDLEINGELRPGWNFQAGYTFALSDYNAGAKAGQLFGTNRSPKHLVKLGTTYRLPGRWHGLTIGASARAQARTYTEGADFYIEQPAYAVADAMARYAFNNQLALQLNINNVFDRSYYQSIATTYHSDNFVGAGRHVLLTLDYRW